MPRRNLVVLFIAAAVCIVSYRQAARNPYAAVIAQAMNTITRRYVEPIEQRELFEGAMHGMVGRLDPNSAFIPPEESRDLTVTLQQEFGGIGIEVTVNPETGRLTVLSPLVGTPAYEAGVRAGDAILEIDGRNAEGISLREAVDYLRGRPGTKVTLKLLHEGDETPVILEMQRAVIQVDSVLGDVRRPDGKWDYRLAEDPRIAYLRLVSFGNETPNELARALASIQSDTSAILLDLRNDAGGLLPTAIEVCDMFIDQGPIVTIRGRDGEVQKEYTARRGRTRVPADVPVAVLVNPYTASAAEIVAACLQDHGRAVIVGERTFGKGTVQNLIPLDAVRSQLKLTTASYWRPSGRNIHRLKSATDADEWGVRPNPGFEVKLSPEEFEQVFRERRRRDIVRPGGGAAEDAATEDGGAADPPPFVDPQLRRAVEYLRSKLDGVPPSGRSENG